MPWRHFNAVDKDGRAWYEDFISAKFIQPVEEAMRVALKDADWDPLPTKTSRGKKAPVVPSRLRMSEGCSLDQELVEIKQQTQPAMALLKKNELILQKENEELAQVEAQITELQVRRDLILERRNQAASAGTELKSSAKQLLKTAAEKKKALAERKLIRTRWLADMDNGDIGWRRITCLIWGMFSEDF
ncbi:uncharacterized protein Pyn_25391 [Prunus yedoensis var. nudiflora]|uniref:Uncharacterized protein n=1 Tax=Prunus yedoensis var. nudiflora TaxID=2094558 RepID=A0A314XF44_PRUYE|nr:uncharacterized protein Pyn_25391 [Prunus yedoensis var. nudiflora]